MEREAENVVKDVGDVRMTSSLRIKIVTAFFLTIALGLVAFLILFEQVIVTQLKAEGIDQEVIRRVMRDFVFQTTGIGMAALVIMIGIAIAFANTITRSLKSLTRAVDEVSEGNLDIDLKITSNDEIGYLGREFDKMTDSIKAAQAELQDYAQNLEHKVAERTEELARSLDEISLLKKQQDGDYFLTTLLIKPLAVNHSRGETSQVDFFIKQKKDFSFRHWHEEIGGDICISHSIILREREYTVILNADAMGKSIQGAGGALVLGAVFEAIIVRTRMRDTLKNNSPEEWLRIVLEELQKIFISFDGNMMMSLVLGLLEDATGMFYYVNSEHPWPVLYRQNKASFLEEEFSCRKLGMPADMSLIRVMNFQLEPGDRLIIGSDGKDDLVPMDAGKEGLVNEDETLFLDFVEQNRADLRGIFSAIKKNWNIKDDLSMVSLQYIGAGVDSDGTKARDMNNMSVEEALALIRSALNARRFEQAETELTQLYNRNDSEPRVVKMLIKLNTLTRNHGNVISYCDAYLNLRPEESKYLYLSSLSLRKLGRLEEAVQAGEKLRAKDPGMVKNLLNLAHTYLLLDQYDQARTVLQEVFSREPSNEHALKIKTVLDRRAVQN